MFDPQIIRRDFPILSRDIHGYRLAYLDNGATSQKPNQVIDAISNYYRQHNANVHRGVHQLGDESTQAFHQARQTIAAFLGAEVEELVIVRNTTEAINQVAYTWGQTQVLAGDVIIATEMEHHSNLVPWQELAHRQGAELELIRVNQEGELELAHLEHLLQDYAGRVKLVALTHLSNTLGTLNPVDEIISLVRQAERASGGAIKVLIDGAQAAPHLPVKFKELDADFYVVSAHKMLGPMGMGALLVKKDILIDLSPFLFGGGMISRVTMKQADFAEDLEERFTAGTPDVAGLVGWAAACEYLSQFSWTEIADHDRRLIEATLKVLAEFPEITVIGPRSVDHRGGLVAFMYQGVHAHDVGQILDSEGVAVRSGHHCTMPLHTKFNWQATIRASFQLYNDLDDVEALANGLRKVKTVFGT